mgnify:FL=1
MIKAKAFDQITKKDEQDPPLRHKKTPTLLDREWTERVALLTRVRQGDEAAIAELWKRYRCRLILPDAPVSEPAVEPTKKQGSWPMRQKSSHKKYFLDTPRGDCGRRGA